MRNGRRDRGSISNKGANVQPDDAGGPALARGGPYDAPVLVTSAHMTPAYALTTHTRTPSGESKRARRRRNYVTHASIRASG
ncbi:hypothetical protein EVAR_50641_1 [Eumeta japonica]|uniref:Uncharacterized protein n=1 Tax=Eumeta variegata TaxID=151549 RepID=A0A4C1XIL1_EUMVA|nr:hypothetical protein EVAR_50641_1 [Eumeta japonica]